MQKIETIFIVDDDAMQADMLADYLSKFPAYKTHIFHSGEECINNLSLNPQIIFLDYYFDKVHGEAMNGIRILKKIKELKPNTEVVMFSGQDRIEVAVNSMKYGAFDYIVKSESAFHRSENAIFNIIKYSKLKHDATFYKKLFFSFLIVFSVVLVIVAILIITGVVHEHFGLEYGA